MIIREGRSLEETPTWSVASVTTVMVFVCLFVERSIYRFGKVRHFLGKTFAEYIYTHTYTLFKFYFVSLVMGIVAEENKKESPLCFFGED